MQFCVQVKCSQPLKIAELIHMNVMWIKYNEVLWELGIKWRKMHGDSSFLFTALNLSRLLSLCNLKIKEE